MLERSVDPQQSELLIEVSASKAPPGERRNQALLWFEFKTDTIILPRPISRKSKPLIEHFNCFIPALVLRDRRATERIQGGH